MLTLRQVFAANLPHLPLCLLWSLSSLGSWSSASAWAQASFPQSPDAPLTTESASTPALSPSTDDVPQPAVDDATASPKSKRCAGGLSVARSGVASWYGSAFHGKRTANGERFDMHALTAAHPTLPFGTRVRVTHIRTGQEVDVRINDRGPHVKGRVIDLSAAAATQLGIQRSGTALISYKVLGKGC